MPGLLTDVRNGKCPIIKANIAYPQDRWTGTADRPMQEVNCLIDTGATHVVITPELVQQLQLPLAGSLDQTVVGATVIPSKTYRCDVVFSGIRAMAPNSPYTYTVSNAEAIETTLSGYDAIIGWDVMGGMDLVFRRDGSFSLHYP